MTGKEYMHDIRKIRRKIRLLEEQIERDTILAAGVSAIRYDKDRVQTSPVGDRMTEIVAKIIETTDKLKAEIYDLQLHEENLIGYLCQLPEEYERVLTYHYLDGVEWKDVGQMMIYADRYIYEVKERALDALTEVLNKTDQIRK